MKLLDQKKKKVILNITPLIDVLFILIIFFTVSSTFLEQPGIKLELPEAKTSAPQRIEKAVLSITPDSKVFLNGNEVALAALPVQLRQMMEQSSDKSLIVSADKGVRHGLVVQVMDIARQNSVEKLVISADPD